MMVTKYQLDSALSFISVLTSRSTPYITVSKSTYNNISNSLRLKNPLSLGPQTTYFKSSLLKVSEKSDSNYSIQDYPEDPNKDDRFEWLSTEDALKLAKKMSLSLSQFDAFFANVMVTDSLSNTITRRVEKNDIPSSLQILFPKKTMTTLQERASVVSDSMIHWCDSFVADLGLCPWARASINSKKAIRIKIIPFYSSDDESIQNIQDKGESYAETMEELVCECSRELAHLAGMLPWEKKESDVNYFGTSSLPKNDFSFDPNVSITFVVAAPFLTSTDTNITELRKTTSIQKRTSLNDHEHNVLEELSNFPYPFDFSNFVEFFNDLDDRFYFEAEDYDLEQQQKCHEDDSSNGDLPLGKIVTLASFHPLWRFASNTESDNAIDFEKRSPYPTISIVLKKAIEDAGGEIITNKISRQNEDILNSKNINDLRNMFLRNFANKME